MRIAKGLTRKAYDNEGILPIQRKDLKALIFWASIGIEYSVDGSYPDTPDVISSMSKLAHFPWRRVRFSTKRFPRLGE